MKIAFFFLFQNCKKLYLYSLYGSDMDLDPTFETCMQYPVYVLYGFLYVKVV